MKRKTLWKKGIVLLLSASMLLTGCGNGGEARVDLIEDPVQVDENGNPIETSGNININNNELAASIKAKYNAAESDYSGDAISVKRSESIQFEIGYNPWENDESSIFDDYAVYQDAELTKKVDVGTIDWDSETGILTIEPPYYGVAELSAGSDIDISNLSGDYLLEDEASGWGNISQYYLAVGVDTETGKKLEQPKVTVVKVEAELSQAPQVKFAQTEQGDARFYWEEVPGAEKYYIFTIKNWPEEGWDNSAQIVGVSDTTEWVSESDITIDEYDERITFGIMNDLFSQYYIADADKDAVAEIVEGIEGAEDILTADYNEYWDDYFGVIAVGQNGCSHISNLMSAQDLCHLLPNTFAYGDELIDVYDGALNLLATMGVTMCDGSLAQKVIDYDYDNIVIDENQTSVEIKATAHGTYFSWPITFDVEDISTVESDLQQVKARQEELLSKGGNIDTTVSFDDEKGEDTKTETDNDGADEVESDDNAQTDDTETNDDGAEDTETKADDNVKSDDAETEDDGAEDTETKADDNVKPDDTETEDDGAEDTETKADDNVKSDDAETNDDGADNTETKADDNVKPDDTETEDDNAGSTESEDSDSDEEDILSINNMRVTANSALSEYIAVCMLNTESAIDLSYFEEAADTSLVADAFSEAQYQNPLILGVQNVSMDTKNQILYVEYDYDSATTTQKQNEILDKVDSVVAEIITDDMTDLEKVMAINAYLCENAEYDDAALENAEANDFYYVDEEFYDSFTAYGTLVDGVGVCASYSAAFKLLADAAGLDSIVVTGYLDGSLPHAWNKVKIGEDWNIVDSTNNDNDVIPNALLNLSDSGASAALLEDERFVLDSNVYDYAANTDDNEFYRTTGNYYDISDAADILGSTLSADGDVTIRTDYSLDDRTFNELAQEAAQNSGKNLQGCYWMGIIRLMEK